jgi:ferric-dicitrate binding protein FerR (iron transport regulator)
MEEIIDRAIRGEATAQELAHLAKWRQESSENERQYHQVVALLAALSKRSTRAQHRPPTAAQLLERGRRRTELRPPRDRPGGTRWIHWGLAAAAILVIGIAVRSRTDSSSAEWQPTEIVTGAGELATVQLPDGSVARVGPSSRMRLMAAHNERVVSLEGHAFFAVAKRPDRPFRVRTRGGDALALGTRFDVSTQERGLRLVVVEGRVALSAKENRTEVDGGQAADMIDGRASKAVTISDPTLLKWMGRFLAFQTTPLPRVAAEIERVYGVRVVLADSSLASETVTAAFTDDPFRQVAGVVCAVIGQRCSITDSVVTISR